MAHRILGIDLGAYSVKVAVAQATLRSTNVVDVLEAPVEPGEGSDEERSLRALHGLVRRAGLEHDLPHWTVSGDVISVRVMDFAFQGVKRADMERAVGGELEQLLPHDLDELVYDFDVIPKDAAAAGPGAATEDAPTAPVPAALPSRAQATTGTRVLAVAATKERVKALLDAGSEIGMEPRSLIAVPTSFARLVERMGAGQGEPLLIVDAGHVRTDVCVAHKGRVVFARSLSRGGKQVSAAIARAWNLPFAQAEAAKHSDGFVASQREPAQSTAWQRISDVITVELQPLARELRQTLIACRTQTGVAPRRVLVCGGGARLRGFASWLGEALELPALTVNDINVNAVLAPALAARGVVVDHALPALGAALEAAGGRPHFDLRKGEYTYKADFSFLRQRAGYLAGLGLAIIAFATVNAYAGLSQLRKEEKMLDERLRVASTELWGAPVPAEEVETKLAPKKDESPLPKHTAFDLLVDVSRRVPPRDKVKFEIAELDIKKDKITIRATSDSAASIDEIEKKLKEITCFEDIARGKVSAGGADEKQFTLTITSKCI